MNIYGILLCVNCHVVRGEAGLSWFLYCPCCMLYGFWREKRKDEWKESLSRPTGRIPQKKFDDSRWKRVKGKFECISIISIVIDTLQHSIVERQSWRLFTFYFIGTILSLICQYLFEKRRKSCMSLKKVLYEK